jgi:hypothetical protein
MLTNDFWDSFRRDFRFQWPFPFREIYQPNAYTSGYTFSTLFQARLLDISMWQMEHSFFASFPELLDDISAAEPLLEDFVMEGSVETVDSGRPMGVEALDMRSFLDVYKHDLSSSV